MTGVMSGFASGVVSGVVSGAILMLMAWLVEVLFGYPDWLYRRIGHPVVWLGALIDGLDRALNRPALGRAWRYVLGTVTTVATVAAAVCAAVAISALVPASTPGLCAEAVIASSLLCSRSLYGHISAVSVPLAAGDLTGVRAAMEMPRRQSRGSMPEPATPDPTTCEPAWCSTARC